MPFILVNIVEENMSQKIALDALRLAKNTLNSMNGMSNREARKFVNELIHPHTRGIWSDEYWRGVQNIWKALKNAGVNVLHQDNFYTHNENGVPDGKTWKFDVVFQNDKSRRTTFTGICRAAGAGSVDDPLDKYDVTCYVN